MKKFSIILLIVLFLGGSLFVSNLYGKSCFCQSPDCLAEIDCACYGCQSTGFWMSSSNCSGTTCNTVYTVRCLLAPHSWGNKTVSCADHNCWGCKNSGGGSKDGFWWGGYYFLY